MEQMMSARPSVALLGAGFENRSVYLWTRVRGGLVNQKQLGIELLGRNGDPESEMSLSRQRIRSLQQSKKLYQSLVEKMRDGYFIITISTGRFLYLNRRICELFGYTQREAERLALRDVITPEDLEHIEKSFRSRLQRNRLGSERQVYYAIRKDGSTFQAEVSASIVSYQGMLAVQGTLRDISENTLSQYQLIQDQRIEAIGTHVGVIAHDFNNLLAIIQGNVSLIQAETASDHPFHQQLKSIEQYIHDGRELSNQLQNLTRGSKEKVRVVDLNRLVQQSSERFARSQKDIAITLKHQQGIWPVEVIQGQIEQALLNLYINAKHAMPGGGELTIKTENVIFNRGDIALQDNEPGRYVRISVSDTGIGMDETTQEHMFDPFFTTKDKNQGTGLGLPSVQDTINNHGGMINVSSKRGEGTTFNIYVPASKKSIQPDSAIHYRRAVSSAKIA